MAGIAVYVPKGRRGTVDASAYMQLGKVHFTVLTPDGLYVVGFLVKQPDIAGMVRRKDIFVALDALAPCDGGVRVVRGADSFDEAAYKRLHLDWDQCVICTGMDVFTQSGKELGYVNDIAFNAKTGLIHRLFVGDGGMSRLLVGSIEIPASLFVGISSQRIVVTDGAAKLALNGGLAAKAGAAAGKAQATGAHAASQAGHIADKALDTGSRALGHQLKKTKGMFGAFMDEYKRASQ